MSGGSAPKPPDPKKTSAAQTGTNVSTAVANAVLQNPNQNTPYGSVEYGFGSEDGGRDYTFTDPYTNKTYTIPRVTVNQTLTDEGQQVQDNNVATQINLSELAEGQSGFLKDYMGKPFQYGPGEHEAWAGGLYDKLSGDQVSQQQDSMAARLANQGIQPGTRAYEQAMSGMTEGQQTARDRFMLDSYQTGQSSALTQRNQPLNEIIGLMNGSQVQQPNFINPNISAIPTTDNASIINTAHAQEMDAWRQKQAAGGSFLSGLGQIGGLFAGF